MTITEEEKIRRRKMIEKNENMVGAGFGEAIDNRLVNMKEREQYINGEITFDEYSKFPFRILSQKSLEFLEKLSP